MEVDNTNNLQEKPWKKDWRKRLIINALALFAFIVIFKCLDNQKQFNRAICHEKQSMQTSNFHFTVTAKFKDSTNHNYNTIKYIDLNKMNEGKVYIINEISGFYNSIRIGDTLFKNGGDLIVHSTSRDTDYFLRYNCIDKKKN